MTTALIVAVVAAIFATEIVIGRPNRTLTFGPARRGEHA
jgi:hypothetical protein